MSTHTPPLSFSRWALPALTVAAIVAGCSSKPTLSPDVTPIGSGRPITQAQSRWIPDSWSNLPGFQQDSVSQAWGAWMRTCQRPSANFASVCRSAAAMSNASDADKRAWMVRHLQPYRVEAHNGSAQGLLTSYYEPVLQGSRLPTATYRFPLHAVPLGGAPRSPWFTRQQIESTAAGQAALRGREIAYMANPIDVMILHIQGSGRMQIQEPNGSTRAIRLAYAGTNNHTFRSPSAYISARGGRVGNWDTVRVWSAQNPSLTTPMLQHNPRYVFFREENIPANEADSGPKGAAGVPLTPGRSIAVDPGSIPYGSAVWLASTGPVATIQRMVIAQDTGNAIRGAVRADYFAGWSQQAADLAHAMKQPLRLWVLWPK